MSKYVSTAVFAAIATCAIAAAQNTPATSALQAAPPATRPALAGGYGSVQGTVKDDTGGVIPGATITLKNAAGAELKTETGADGTYRLKVPPGTYTVAISYTGLQAKPFSVSVFSARIAAANVVMSVEEQKQEVTVTDTAENQVSTEAANNASALVLKQEDLDALPDDPDDLEADLQALAGPSAGPGGNQIYIDGFTGGRLPPKESIREIRINSNPFSAEFDKLGYGRIQVFTKPGSDKFHGQGYYTISDGVWNSRNPFLTAAPPFRTQLFGGNVSGPLGKHGSFFIDTERRNIDDNGIVTASIPTPDFLGSRQINPYVPTPQRRTTVSPRVDYQIGTNNTLSLRYAWLENDRLLTGVGGFQLPTTTVNGITLQNSGYTRSSNEQSVQIVETAVLNAKAVNETHFHFERSYENDRSQSLVPGLQVQGSFVSGGSGYSAPGFPASYDLENYYELQNYTSLTWGTHTSKFGLRIRASAIDDLTATGYNGTYQFNGGAFPMLGADGLPIAGTSQQLSSIQQYLTTMRLLNAGLTSQQVTAFGYGPSKYTVVAGQPYIGLSQLDFGPFFQDDWRVRPNLTLSFGVRWEAQTNIHDKNDWAPRFGFAWSPGGAGRNSRPKTVIRGGWGYFYQRFDATNVLTAFRNNGKNQTTYTLNAPTVYDASFDTAAAISTLGGAILNASQVNILDSNLMAPRLMQTVIGVERQVLPHVTATVNYMYSRGTHQLRTVDINAPYPVPGTLPPGAPLSLAEELGVPISDSLVRPYGDIGDIYDYQSSGIFKQHQILVSVNGTAGKWLTLFSRYAYSDAHSDTDGLASLATDPYNFAADWGRSALDMHHNVFLGGSLATRWGLRFSPFLVAHSGIPFNVTTGTDLFLQGQKGINALPSVASGPGPYIVDTPYGFLNPYPIVPEPGTSNFLERNIGNGPGFLGLNLRVSKTWGFGTTKFQGTVGGARAGGRGRGGFGGGGFHGGGFGGESSEHRYNLTLSVNARNILNHENLSAPVGVITSPYFLESTGITGGYGAEATASDQRRIDLQLRFAF